MDFRFLTKDDIIEASKLAIENYKEEKEIVCELPDFSNFTLNEYFTKENRGVCAIENGKLIGYLACFKPWVDAFGATGKLGTFIPLHAHACVKTNRKDIYQRMYEFMSNNLVKDNVLVHGICLYAHDKEANQAFYEYGFGMQCNDEIRKLDSKKEIKKSDFTFSELELKDFPKIRNLRVNLDDYLRLSPCFLNTSKEEFEDWLKDVEKGDRRTFVCKKGNEFIGYLDISDEGENILTECDKMINIQGAYLKPEYRGLGIYQDLLDYVSNQMIDEGYTIMGVDHESHNPCANRFWPKNFTIYTNSVIRKIY